MILNEYSESSFLKLFLNSEMQSNCWQFDFIRSFYMSNGGRGRLKNVEDLGSKLNIVRVSDLLKRQS